MSNPTTTVNLKGKDFPFYRTNRGQFDFENAGYTTNDIANGKVSAMLAYVYYSARACARRANINWPYTDLGKFVDDTDESVLDVFLRLADAEKEDKKLPDEGTDTDEPGNQPQAVD